MRFRPQRGLRNTVWIAYSGVFRDGFAVPSHFYGSLAQLVQSICLTSRGSGVRIPQLPLQRKTIGFPIVFFRLSASESRLPPLCQTKKRRNTVPPIRPAAVGEVYMGLRGGGCLRLRLTSRGRRAMAPPFESLNSHYGGRRLVFQSSFFVCPRRPKNISRQPQLFCSKYRIFQEYISLTCANQMKKRRVAPP